MINYDQINGVAEYARTDKTMSAICSDAGIPEQDKQVYIMLHALSKDFDEDVITPEFLQSPEVKKSLEDSLMLSRASVQMLGGLALESGMTKDKVMAQITSTTRLLDEPEKHTHFSIKYNTEIRPRWQEYSARFDKEIEEFRQGLIEQNKEWLAPEEEELTNTDRFYKCLSTLELTENPDPEELARLQQLQEKHFQLIQTVEDEEDLERKEEELFRDFGDKTPGNKFS